MTTYLFPGQGTQAKGMGQGLFEAFRELTAQADEVLGYSIVALCLEDRQQQLRQTQYTQPALYVVNALSYRQQLQEASEPDYVAGHSLGEYNALEVAGVFSFADGLKLVQKRGELMAQAPKGAMAAILDLGAEDIRQCLDDHGLGAIDIANENAPAQTVISGLETDVISAQAVLEQAGGVYIPLNTSGAFHSRYMLPVQSQFADFIEGFTLNTPRIPVISNVHAVPYEATHLKDSLVAQITQPVKWMAIIRYLLTQGEKEFIELGVGDVLSKLTTAICAANTPSGTKASVVKEIGVTQNIQINAAEKRTRQKESWDLQQRIETWNSSYPVGSPVRVAGYDDVLETRTEAMVLFGHRVAIYLKDLNGYFVLEDVQPLTAVTDVKMETLV